MNKTYIKSKSNPWVQQWQRWHAKPVLRKSASLAWLEGVHLAQEAFARENALRFSISHIVIPDNPQGHAALEQLEVQFKSSKSWEALQCVILSDAIFASLSTLDSKPNVCTVLQLKPVDFRTEVTTSAMVLDGIQDPGNVGTLVRLCAAFGVSDVYLSEGSASAWSAKSLRAGQGAQLAVNVYEDIDLALLYPALAAKNIPVFATSLSENAMPLGTLSLPKKMAWVLGHEGQGISKLSQTSASQCVYIPMQGGFESLNVASAAAICLWQWQQHSR